MGNSKLDAALPPTLHTTSLGYPEKHHDSTLGLGTPKSDGQSAYDSGGAEDTIDTTSSTLYTRSSIYLVLGNFFIAMFLISVIIFLIFLTVNWFILQDTRSLNHRVFSNSTGVSLCLYHNEWMSSMTVVMLVINTRRQPSTGSRGIHVVHFVEDAGLRCGQNSRRSVLGRSYPRPL